MKKLHLLVLGALLVVLVITASALLGRGQAWGDDFAAYIMQAKSILNGTETQYLVGSAFSVNYSSLGFGPVTVPWGYPAFLALLYPLVGLNPLALNASNILFLVLFTIFFTLLLKNRLAPLAAILAAAVVVFSPKVITYENNITSDIAFMSLSTLSLLLIDRFTCGDHDSSASVGENAALGAAIFLAFFVRATGILLLVTLLACQILSLYRRGFGPGGRRKRITAWLAPYLAFGLLLGITALAFPSSQGYVHENLSYIAHTFTLGMVKDHLWYYFHRVDTSFLNSLPGPLIVYGILLGFFALGLIARLGKDDAIMIYSALYIPVIVIYPSLGGFRLLFPVLPFFVYFSYLGMNIGFSGLQEAYRRVGQVIIPSFWLIILLFFLSSCIALARANLAAGRQMAGPFDPSSTEMFNFVKVSTPPDSVIVFFKPRAMHLLADRNAIAINQCNLLNRGNLVVLLKGETGDQIAVDTIGSCGLDLKPVFENGKYIAYQLAQ